MKKREKTRKSRKNIEELEEYIPYIGGDLSPEKIEFLFQQQEQYQQAGIDSTTANMKLLKENATTDDLPLDVFMKIDDNEQSDSDSDQFFDYDSDNESNLSSFRNSKKKPCHQSIPYFLHQIKIGAFFELWSTNKLSANLMYNPFDHPISEFPYSEPIISIDEYNKQLKETTFIQLQHLSPSIALKHIPKNTEAIVLDPPIQSDPHQQIQDDNSEWGYKDLLFFFKEIKRRLNFVFIVIWVDPETVQTISNATTFADFIFCDSCVVELYNGDGTPINIPAQCGMVRHSRMLFIYTTSKANNGNYAKQRTRDTSWGTIIPNGKSRGRLGMPSVPHLMVDGFLPNNIETPRTFVEIWPTRCVPHPGWVLIDENE